MEDDPGLKNFPPAILPVANMLKYRGHTSIEHKSSGTAIDMLHGKGQRYVFPPNSREDEVEGSEGDGSHPRPDADTLVMIDRSTIFARESVKSNIKNLFAAATSLRLHPTSSIIFVYGFPATMSHTSVIERTYSSILSDSGQDHQYYLETIPYASFFVDWTSPRSTRNWRLRKGEYFVWMRGLSGSNILVDRPPYVLSESSEIKFIGGRSGDYVSYERLENGGCGPMWLHSMRKVVSGGGNRLAEAIAESTVDDEGDVD